MNYTSMILEAIQSSTDHPTAEQIYLNLKSQGSRIALATVYNNLARLLSGGSIRKISVEGCPDRYDRIDKHDHLVCRRCGGLSDISFTDLTSMLQSQTDEQVLDYDLRVSYICPVCRRKEQDKQPTGDQISLTESFG